MTTYDRVFGGWCDNLSLARRRVPEKPEPGDYIALDWDGTHNSDFGQGISWHCSRVVERCGNKYRVEYNKETGRWYTFNQFGRPKPDRHGVCWIFPAIPDAQTEHERDE